jgi:hypothetical protein
MSASMAEWAVGIFILVAIVSTLGRINPGPKTIAI